MDIKHIVFEFDIRTEYLYSYPLSKEKSGYPKIPSEPVFTIFESRSRWIFSEPYYIPTATPTRPLPQTRRAHTSPRQLGTIVPAPRLVAPKPETIELSPCCVLLHRAWSIAIGRAP
jgi:hypothetical protein